MNLLIPVKFDIQGGPFTRGHLNTFSNCNDAKKEKDVYFLPDTNGHRKASKNIFLRLFFFQGPCKVVDAFFHLTTYVCFLLYCVADKKIRYVENIPSWVSIHVTLAL